MTKKLHYIKPLPWREGGYGKKYQKIATKKHFQKHYTHGLFAAS